MDKSMVSDRFDIDIELLEHLAQCENSGDFFNRSLSFFEEVQGRDAASLSQKQLNCLFELESVLHDRKQNQEICVNPDSLSERPEAAVSTPFFKKVIAKFRSFLFKQ